MKTIEQELSELYERAQLLKNALTEIGAFADDAANDRLANTGSYSSFDEPYSVETARIALKADLAAYRKAAKFAFQLGPL